MLNKLACISRLHCRKYKYTTRDHSCCSITQKSSKAWKRVSPPYTLLRTTTCDVTNCEWWNGIGGSWLSVFYDKNRQLGTCKSKISVSVHFCCPTLIRRHKFQLVSITRQTEALLQAVSFTPALISVKCFEFLPKCGRTIYEGERESPSALHISASGKRET